MRKVAVTTTLLTSLLFACADERPVINRVQAVALQKSFYVGANLVDTADDPEFYMRGTVVDVGYGAAQDGLFTSTYAQPVSRIKWEITETMLNARLAYERIQGTDSKGLPTNGLVKKASNDGQIVAAYRISSHFDIKRAYNSTTGEALNIVEENASDRAWYQREYMRVDWSQNLATDVYDFDTLSMMGIYGGITYEPIPYAITDEKHPDAPHFDTAAGYFDVTTKAFARPGVIDLSGMGWGIDKFPSCMLPGEFAGGTEPYGNCNPVEITLRYSFRKVVDNDYEPVDYDGYRFQAYGFFTGEYKGYERNYGMVDNKWFRFAARFNVWDRHHYYSDPAKMTGAIQCDNRDATLGPTADPASDPNRDTDGDGTSDECAEVTARTGFGGSRCDVFKGKCTLPYQARKAKTIAWYINGNTEPDLFEATNWGVQEWNLGMQTANMTAKLVECRRTNGSDCDTKYPMWSGQQDDYDDAINVSRVYEVCLRQKGWKASECTGVLDQAVAAIASERNVGSDDANVRAIGEVVKSTSVIVLCHNPVLAEDHSVCGPVGTAPRQGDIRYNNVLVIDKPQQPSAWGIMVDADDPITGEKVAASINIWSHVTDLASMNLLDLVRYMNGELSTADVTNGQYVLNWAQAQRVSGDGVTPPMSKDEVNTRLAGATKLDPEAFARITANGMPQEIKDRLRSVRSKIHDTASSSNVASPSQAMVDAVMGRVRGTPAEAKLINAAQLQLAGLKGNLPVTGQVKNIASPLGLNHPKMLSQLRNLRENALARRGACIVREAPETSALTGMADILKKKFPMVQGESGDDTHKRHLSMFRYIRRRFHYAVLAHEMGHSIGLRHNFVSSYGALHYRPQYWQLRTKNGAVTRECTDVTADGATCVGPRFYDPVTAEEQDQLIWMFMQSSVMDYPGDLSQDMIGLGTYDYAAARMLYGDTVAVYKDTSKVSAGSRIGVGMTAATDNFGGLLGIRYSIGSGNSTVDMHYSQLQKNYSLINGCYDVAPSAPSWWRADVDGQWDPVLDGKIVAVNGQFKKCRQMTVDYSGWNSLRNPTADELAGSYYRGGPSIDPDNRIRVPHHFATDHWADTGNVSVFRHDNGADPYEQVQFLVTTQENRHIFDNFRRGRTTFSIRGAADRSFSRYNEKLVGISGGMAFLSNVYKNFATSTGYTFDTLWPVIVNEQAREQILAASIAFDHFTRQISRPEAGDHYKRDAEWNDGVLRSNNDADGADNDKILTIPNGTTGFLRDVGIGGRPMENTLSDNHGDYDTDYNQNAGSYYDKINAFIHMSISEDRFISQSRGDFYDARFRANGMADIFPDGYRRVLGNLLTGDRSLLAPRVAADASGNPQVDAEGYPTRPIGWTSWWPTNGPQTCFASGGRNACAVVDGSNVTLHPDLPAKTAPIDPQVGWEVQKFAIAWSIIYIIANQRSDWTDMMKIWKIGSNANPELHQRLEWEDPVSGTIYVSKAFGKECLFGTGATCTGGQFVQKGIAARVLEWANYLTSKGYKLDTVTYPAATGKPAGFNEFGRAMVLHHPDGAPIVASDPAMKVITPTGNVGPARPDCDRNITPACTALTMYDNHFAMDLYNYKAVPDYLQEFLGLIYPGLPGELGLY